MFFSLALKYAPFAGGRAWYCRREFVYREGQIASKSRDGWPGRYSFNHLCLCIKPLKCAQFPSTGRSKSTENMTVPPLKQTRQNFSISLWWSVCLRRYPYAVYPTRFGVTVWPFGNRSAETSSEPPVSSECDMSWQTDSKIEFMSCLGIVSQYRNGHRITGIR
jgi:hypothetical protein